MCSLQLQLEKSYRQGFADSSFCFPLTTAQLLAHRGTGTPLGRERWRPKGGRGQGTSRDLGPASSCSGRFDGDGHSQVGSLRGDGTWPRGESRSPGSGRVSASKKTEHKTSVVARPRGTWLGGGRVQMGGRETGPGMYISCPFPTAWPAAMWGFLPANFM